MGVINTTYDGSACPCCGVHITCCPNPSDKVPKVLYAHVVGQGVIQMTYSGFITNPEGPPRNVYTWDSVGTLALGGACAGQSMKLRFTCDPESGQFFINFTCTADGFTYLAPEPSTYTFVCPSDGPFAVNFTGVLLSTCTCEATFDVSILTTP